MGDPQIHEDSNFVDTNRLRYADDVYIILASPRVHDSLGNSLSNGDQILFNGVLPLWTALLHINFRLVIRTAYGASPGTDTFREKI
jgi:hypothetical protein